MFQARFILAFLLAGAFVGLLGCRQPADPASTATVAPTVTWTPAPTETATPGATATPQPTPTAEPTATTIPVSLRVDDQNLLEDGLLKIAEVSLPTDGWVALSNSTGGWLAAVAVPAGVSTDLIIEVDPYQTVSPLTATLYQDLGEPGVWELPGIDVPFTTGESAISHNFDVRLELTLPGLIVVDQRLDEEGLVQIAEVTALSQSWVIIANQDGIDQPLGMTRVEAGVTRDVLVKIPWRQANPDLVAFLATDAGSQGMYDGADGDAMVRIAGQPLQLPFHVELPPDIFVFDQQLTDTGEIVVERVVAQTRSWLVLRQDADGELGNAVGEILLLPGVNERLVIPVAEDAVTPMLFAVLHQDAGVPGVFDFPGDDGLLAYEDANGFRYFPRFPFRTNTASYLITTDQPGGDSVLVPYVMAAQDSWLVIRGDVDGEPGGVVGQVLLTAGFHWDVEVPLDSAQMSGVWYASLHLDADNPGLFDFPDADPPLQVAAADVVASFELTGSDQ